MAVVRVASGARVAGATVAGASSVSSGIAAGAGVVGVAAGAKVVGAPLLLWWLSPVQ